MRPVAPSLQAAGFHSSYGRSGSEGPSAAAADVKMNGRKFTPVLFVSEELPLGSRAERPTVAARAVWVRLSDIASAVFMAENSRRTRAIRRAYLSTTLPARISHASTTR